MPSKKINMRQYRSDKTVKSVSRTFAVTGIVLVLFTIVNLVIQNWVYVQVTASYQSSIQSINTMNAIQESFKDVNENVLLLIASIDTTDFESVGSASLANIEEEFAEIDTLTSVYEADSEESRSEALMRRFHHAEYAITAYRRKINEIKDSFTTLQHEDAINMYNQELSALQVIAAEMLDAAVDISTAESEEAEYQTQMLHSWAQAILMVMLALMIIILCIIFRRQLVTIVEVKEKEKEVGEASQRLTKSRKKLLDSAMTNILTGMKNRYALDESLAQLIGNAQFNIAAFDIDNFRVFNDMYGYELGDEYLVTVAERLKAEYSEYAEMFNITGNEFCMIFYEHVSDIQAQQLSEQIRQGIGQPTQVAGVILQATVSASLYHYLPSDNLDVNTLLMKLDSALHAAKRDGGNRMYQIQ